MFAVRHHLLRLVVIFFIIFLYAVFLYVYSHQHMLKNLKKDSMFHNVETSAFINNIVINQTKKESDFLFGSVSINYRNKY